jgi:hypothetical protein
MEEGGATMAVWLVAVAREDGVAQLGTLGSGAPGRALKALVSGTRKAAASESSPHGKQVKWADRWAPTRFSNFPDFFRVHEGQQL